MIVCVCHNISESAVRSAIRAGNDSMHLLQQELSIGSCCGKCKSCTKKILRETVSQAENLHAQIHTLHFQNLAC